MINPQSFRDRSIPNSAHQFYRKHATMNSLDPSNMHSVGWMMQDQATVPKKLLVPDLNAVPPTGEECKKWGAFLARVEKFYTDGADNQIMQRKQIVEEMDLYKLHKQRVSKQQQSLNTFPSDLTRKKTLDGELEKEGNRLSIEINARERALEKLQVLNQKRSELVRTMTYLQKIFDEHCTKINTKAT